MISSELLLLPDTGDQFAQCLKTAALYSEQIYCVSSIALDLAKETFASGAEQPGEGTLRFLEAAKAHESDIALLQREGIAATPDDYSEPTSEEWSEQDRHEVFTKILLTCYMRYEIAKRLVRSGKVNASFLEQSGRNRAMRSSPPSAWHILEDRVHQIWSAQDNKEIRKLLRAEVIARSVFEMYLKLLTEAADSNGVTILTYSEPLQQSLSEVRLYPSSSALDKTDDYVKAQVEEYRRRAAGHKLAHTVLSYRLPRVDDLALEDILELRRKHNDEIAAFRVALDEMAAQVDTSKPPERDDEQVKQLIRTKIDPSVEDLRAAIKNSRLDMLKNLYGPKETAAAATVSASISYMTHATTPGNIAASLVAVLFPAISALICGHLERKRLMNANKWSLLLHVEKLD